MKKLCVLIASALFLLAAAGCGGSNVKASDKAISVGKQVIAVVDDYLDGKLTYDDAYEAIDQLHSDMDYASDLAGADMSIIADNGVYSRIFGIQIDMIDENLKNDSESYDELIESRNVLADYIGEDKR